MFCCKKRVKNIGEVIKNISKDVKKNYAEISWKDITGMRDILIHEYFGVDLELR
ncbi:MAG TPA: HepT-like ribonuclease domain-containing protein [Nitrospinota bacterium]|nr:HepT-like ribonuclease domain-containing protein [Nitrospinota bacterium]